MVLWQGLTEGGTAVPVQVTEAGKVVAEGQQGPPGPPGEQGPQGPQGEYGPGDDVDLGSATFAGTVGIGGLLNADGSATFAGAIESKDAIVSNRSDSSKPAISAQLNGATTASINTDGSATFAGKVSAGGLFPGADCVLENGSWNIYQTTNGLPVFNAGWDNGGGRNITSSISSDGSASFAENKCGFTAAGELYFTSRGTRYKLEVAGGLCNAIEYTRELELRERAEELKERIDDKRKPRPTDSVPED